MNFADQHLILSFAAPQARAYDITPLLGRSRPFLFPKMQWARASTDGPCFLFSGTKLDVVGFPHAERSFLIRLKRFFISCRRTSEFFPLGIPMS